MPLPVDASAAAPAALLPLLCRHHGLCQTPPHGLRHCLPSAPVPDWLARRRGPGSSPAWRRAVKCTSNRQCVNHFSHCDVTATKTCICNANYLGNGVKCQVGAGPGPLSRSGCSR